MTAWNTNMDAAPRDGTAFLAALRVRYKHGPLEWQGPHVIAFDAEGFDFICGDLYQGWNFDDYEVWMPLVVPDFPDLPPPPDGTETDG